MQKQNNLIILLSVLLFISLVIAGFFAYQTQQLVNELRVTRDELQQTPTPTSDPTTNWKTYTNKDLSFKYPADWLSSGNVISPDMPGSPHNNLYPYGLFLNVFDKNATLKSNAYTYNGCMEEISTQGADGVFVKRFKAIATGQCKDGNQRQRIIWIVPSAIRYGPGVTVYYQVDDSGQIEQIVAQILSTFKFLDDIPVATKVPLKTLKYNLPQGWSTAKYYNNAFELGYDPSIYETKVSDSFSDKNSLWIVKKNSMTPYSNSFIFSLLPYDGGSRHKFIYNQIGETPTKDDLYKDYKELEYNISGKSCLILDGITISQYPVVWAMCAVGNKAILMTTFDRNNYLSILQTLKIN